MTNSSHSPQTDLWIARTLQAGIILSAALMTAGLLLLSVHGGTLVVPAENPSIGDIVRSFFGETERVNTASALMFAGFLVLMVTPILRVITTFIVYVRERDWRYAAVASIVLLMLVGELLFAFL